MQMDKVKVKSSKKDKPAADATKRAATPAPRPVAAPLADLRSEIDRLFSDFSGRFPGLSGGNLFDWEPWRGPAGFAAPKVDFAEKNGMFEIVAELPGLDGDDVSVELKDNMLTLSGEKREETDREEKEYHLSERRFGSFRRSFRLPTGVDEAKVEAAFENGVLRVTLPKVAEAAKQPRKIAVKGK